MTTKTLTEKEWAILCLELDISEYSSFEDVINKVRETVRESDRTCPHDAARMYLDVDRTYFDEAGNRLPQWDKRGNLRPGWNEDGTQKY